jgi:hypothetical protein
MCLHQALDLDLDKDLDRLYSAELRLSLLLLQAACSAELCLPLLQVASRSAEPPPPLPLLQVASRSVGPLLLLLLQLALRHHPHLLDSSRSVGPLLLPLLHCRWLLVWRSHSCCSCF